MWFVVVVCVSGKKDNRFMNGVNLNILEMGFDYSVFLLEIRFFWKCIVRV